MDKKISLYWTVIGGLIWTIILIVTFRQCSNPDPVAYIGFAATITSLVLGVVAIFYSIISNNQSSENIGVLREASEKISNGADRTQEVEQKLSSSIENLQEVYREIKGKIDELPAHFKSVEDKWDGTDKFLREKLSAANDGQSVPSYDVKDDFVKQFLENCSFSGLQLYYAISLMKSKGDKSIDLVKLEEACSIKENHNLVRYFQGYFICSVSIGILGGKLDGDSIDINYINEYLNLNVREVIYKLVERQTDYKSVWEEKVKNLEKLFST